MSLYDPLQSKSISSYRTQWREKSVFPVVVGDVPVLDVGLHVALAVLGGVHRDLGNVLLDDPTIFEHNLQNKVGPRVSGEIEAKKCTLRASRSEDMIKFNRVIALL